MQLCGTFTKNSLNLQQSDRQILDSEWFLRILNLRSRSAVSSISNIDFLALPGRS